MFWTVMKNADFCDCMCVHLHVNTLKRRGPWRVDVRRSSAALPFIRLKVKSAFGWKDEGQLLPLSSEGSQSTKPTKQKGMAAG